MRISKFTVIPAVHLLLVRHEQILMLRRFNTGYEDGNYSVPAGHLDGREPASAAMAREAVEEIGISINVSQLQVAHVMHRNCVDEHVPHERFDFFFTADRWQGIPEIREPDKCDRIAWFRLVALPSNTVPYVRAAIDAVTNGRAYSEFGWPD
jgi:8-oxo-dGTP diphosphatase